MEQPWEESLDVDDSDLHPPTLRPCKQQRCGGDQTSSIATAADTATTAYVSQSQTLDSSQSLSQTAISVPLNLTSAYQADPQPQPHTIPGPAGVVQAAKLRKNRDIANCVGQEEHPMATQEYIRKAVEDPGEDEDFKRNPWLSTIEFLHSDGMFHSALNAHLGQINKCEETGKLDQIAAVIKSSTPNGLGDMMVTLKDPTGTVSGTIHYKVLTEGDFRKGICVGSVLVLHKVSVVSPSRSTHYLNITKKNLVKVFYKDGGSSQKQTFHGTLNAAPHSQVFYKDGGSSQTQAFHGTVNAAPHSALSSQDSVGGTLSLSSKFSVERGSEGIVSRMKRSKNNNEEENMSYTNTSNKDTNVKIARDKETLKEANVGQLNERFGWTDELIQEISDWDYN